MMKLCNISTLEGVGWVGVGAKSVMVEYDTLIPTPSRKPAVTYREIKKNRMCIKVE